MKCDQMYVESEPQPQPQLQIGDFAALLASLCSRVGPGSLRYSVTHALTMSRLRNEGIAIQTRSVAVDVGDDTVVYNSTATF